MDAVNSEQHVEQPAVSQVELLYKKLTDLEKELLSLNKEALEFIDMVKQKKVLHTIIRLDD